MTSIPVPVQVIKDLKGSDYSWSYQTPPSSPGSSSSRKSSMCRSVGGRHGRLPPNLQQELLRGPQFSSCVTEGFASGEGEYTLGPGPAGSAGGFVREQLPRAWGHAPCSVHSPY